MLKETLDDNTNYYFMISFKTQYVGVSFFSKSEKDYTANQMKLTMLRKEKYESDSYTVKYCITVLIMLLNIFENTFEALFCLKESHKSVLYTQNFACTLGKLML